MKIRMPRDVALEILRECVRPNSLPICCSNEGAMRQPGKESEKITMACIGGNLKYFWLYDLMHDNGNSYDEQKYEFLFKRGIELGLGGEDSQDINCNPGGAPVALVSVDPIKVSWSKINDLDKPGYRLARMWAHADSSLQDWSMKFMAFLASATVDENDMPVRWMVLGTTPQARFAKVVAETGFYLPYRLTDSASPPESSLQSKKSTLDWVCGYDEDGGDNKADLLFYNNLLWNGNLQGYLKAEYIEKMVAVSIDEIRRLWDEDKLVLEITKNSAAVLRKFDKWRKVNQFNLPGFPVGVGDPYEVCLEDEKIV